MPNLTAVIGPLTWRAARAAAAGVRRADLARPAVRTVRPYGVALVRARGPLSLRLYLGSRDGLLVYCGADSFAVLEPPAAEPFLPRGGPVLRLLRVVDRHWEFLVFAVPPLVLLVAAFLVGATRTSSPVALGLVALALVYVMVVLGAGVLRALVWLSRLGHRRGSIAESAPTYQWSVALLHQVDAGGVDDLVRLASDRLSDIIDRRVRTYSRVEGARLGPVVPNRMLVVLTSGVTTRAGRDRLLGSTWAHQVPYGPSGGVILLLSDGRPDRPSIEPAAGGGSFLLLYLAAVALAIAVSALILASDEAARCADAECTGRPVTWGAAVRYLSQRLLLSDPDGLTPAGPGGTALGWLMSLLGLMAVVVTIAAGRQEVIRFRAEKRDWSRMLADLAGRSRVLLLVVTEVERDAVLATALKLTGRPARVRFTPRISVYGLGGLGEADVFLVQAGDAGTMSGAAMGHTARTAIELISPDYAILTGICYGLKPHADAQAPGPKAERGNQRLGDVLVSRTLQGLDHIAVRESDGQLRVVRRAEHVQAAQVLIDRCQAAQTSWSADGPKVHFGQMLSANMLVDSAAVVAALRREFPDAIGGDMEGIGLSVSARLEKVDWIMVKAIADWANGKTKDYQEEAAGNAAGFVLHLLDMGGLDRPRQPGGQE